MKTSRHVINVAAALVLAASACAQAQVTGIPTGDVANFVQNSISAQEGIKQTMKQVEQYKTQLEQYVLEIKNATAPAAYVWDQAQKTMDALRSAIDTLAYYKRQLGSIDYYLRQFNDVGDYRNSPCFGTAGCTKAELARLQEKDRLASESQKKANDALIMSVDQQQSALQADARRLQQLQASAQGAQGQLEALGAANMLASQQSNQFLQIRGLLVAQQNALAARLQAQADREARETAAGEAFRAGTYTPSPRQAW
jgi:P-type conjugative transfer protein TrbJ